MKELIERVVILEQSALANDAEIKQALFDIRKHMEDEDSRWQEIDSRLQKLEKFFEKFTGFLGGIILTVTSIFAVVQLTINYWKN